jgi:lycopene beta-cyclase
LHPRLAVALVDAGPQIGGHHTWSFHHSDVSPAALEWLSPLTVKSWSRQRVEFPLVSRQIDVGYSSIRSDRFHSVIAASVGTGLASPRPLRGGRAQGSRCL